MQINLSEETIKTVYKALKSENYVDKDGEKYLASKKCLYAIYQFNAKDFYVYTGGKEVGEIDKSFCFEGVIE